MNRQDPREAAPPSTREFGPYRFVPESLELSRRGVRVPLAPKPAKLLKILLDRRGSTVPREEIIAALWPDRIVSYDKSLNFTVLELRRALGDDARSPLYVETVPRIGYRFVAEVRNCDGHEHFVTRPARPARTGRSKEPRLSSSRGRWSVSAASRLPTALLLSAALLLSTLAIASVALQRVTLEDGKGTDRSLARLHHLRGVDLQRALSTTEVSARHPELEARALRHLEQATELEPRHADYWLTLAEARLRQALRRPELLPLAADATRRALALDPASPRAHLRQGDVKSLLEHDWRGAEAAYAKALELDPLLAEAHRHLSTHYLLLGRFGQAIDHAERALEIEPFSSTVAGEVGWTYLYAGRPREALNLCDRALEIDPQFVHARQCVLYASTLVGDLERSRSEALGLLHGIGDPQETVDELEVHRSPLDALHRRYARREGAVGWERIDRALAMAALGRSEEALSALERAEEERVPQLLFRIRDPRLESLRQHRRFQALMARLGLEA